MVPSTATRRTPSTTTTPSPATSLGGEGEGGEGVTGEGLMTTEGVGSETGEGEDSRVEDSTDEMMNRTGMGTKRTGEEAGEEGAISGEEEGMGRVGEGEGIITGGMMIGREEEEENINSLRIGTEEEKTMATILALKIFLVWMKTEEDFGIGGNGEEASGGMRIMAEEEDLEEEVEEIEEDSEGKKLGEDSEERRIIEGGVGLGEDLKKETEGISGATITKGPPKGSERARGVKGEGLRGGVSGGTGIGIAGGRSRVGKGGRGLIIMPIKATSLWKRVSRIVLLCGTNSFTKILSFPKTK